MGVGLLLEIFSIFKGRAVVADKKRKNGVVCSFVLRENIGGRSVEVRILEAGGESGKRPDLSWHLLIQLETLEEHGLAAVKHPRIEEIFGSVADLYGLSALEAKKAILGAEQEVGPETSSMAGEATRVVPVGPSAGTRRLRSSSPLIEVVKREKRRKKGVAPQEKGVELTKGGREKGAKKEDAHGSPQRVKERCEGGCGEDISCAWGGP
ncbi:hypothetical protein Dimus_022589 [Dionaea muscipula]